MYNLQFYDAKNETPTTRIENVKSILHLIKLFINSIWNEHGIIYKVI